MAAAAPPPQPSATITTLATSMTTTTSVNSASSRLCCHFCSFFLLAFFVRKMTLICFPYTGKKLVCDRPKNVTVVSFSLNTTALKRTAPSVKVTTSHALIEHRGKAVQ